MSEKPTLLSSPGSHHCRRVNLLIHELGLDVNLQTIDVRPPGMGGENESADFMKLNPNAKVPVLRDGDLVLTESNAIMVHLCEKHGHSPLWPADLGERSQVLKWQFWQAAHLSPTADGLLAQNMVLPMMGEQPNAEVVDRLIKDFHRWAGVLDGVLGKADYLVANRLTCADLSVVTALMYAQPARIPVDEHPPLAAWLDRMHSRPSWEATKPPPMGPA